MGIFMPSYSYSYARSQRRYPKRAKAAAFMFKAEDVWSAAAAATRINGTYLKEPRFESVTDSEGYQGLKQTHEANKVLVRKLLDANQGWTEEDVARGAEARAYWQAQLLKMVGDTANDFEKMAVQIANKESIEGNYDLAVLSSLVASAERGKAREVVNDSKMETNSKHVGNIEDRLVLKDAEVIAVSGLSDFGKYRVDAKFNGNLFTWWSGVTYEAGTKISVKGRVKGHIQDRATKVAVTQLNYVKEI